MEVKTTSTGDGLDAIAAEAAVTLGGEQPGAPGEAAAPAPPAVDQDELEAKQWGQLPALFGSIVCVVMPELTPAYSPANCDAWGKAMLPVARHYGWTIGDAGIWVGLAVASAPMVGPTVQAIRIRRQAAAKAPKQERPASPANTGTGTVTDTVTVTDNATTLGSQPT